MNPIVLEIIQHEAKRPGLLRGIARSVGFLFLATIILGLSALAIYALELDYTVRAKLEGKRWALPARVYARPLELFGDMSLSAQQFADESMTMLRFEQQKGVEILLPRALFGGHGKGQMIVVLLGFEK